MTDDVERRCNKALAETRAYILSRAKYFASLLYGLIPHYVEGFGTLAVSKGMVLILDPEWFITMPVDMRGGCLVHECCHVARGMARLERMPNKDLANIAADLPINHDLRQAKWSLPDWVLYPESFNLPPGRSMEWYYEQLHNEAKKHPQGLKGYLSDTLGKGGGKDGSGNSPPMPPQGKRIGAGSCGSCAGEESDEKQKEIDREHGRGAADRERIRKKAVQEIAAASEKGGSGIGSVPHSLRELLEYTGNERSVVPWRSRLSHVTRRAHGVITAGRSDYSLKRPSKRSVVRGLIVPGLIERKPVIGMIEDTSGSMSYTQLKAGRIEACAVLEQLGIQEAWWISADADVAAPPKVVTLREIKQLEVVGRGGTDFRPGIEAAVRLRPKPDILFYLTDGWGPAPESAPRDTTVIWCIVPGSGAKRPCNWGELIVMSDEIEDQNLYEDDDEEDAA